jgi:hypothetical protein
VHTRLCCVSAHAQPYLPPLFALFPPLTRAPLPSFTHAAHLQPGRPGRRLRLGAGVLPPRRCGRLARVASGRLPAELRGARAVAQPARAAGAGARRAVGAPRAHARVRVSRLAACTRRMRKWRKTLTHVRPSAPLRLALPQGARLGLVLLDERAKGTHAPTRRTALRCALTRIDTQTRNRLCVCICSVRGPPSLRLPRRAHLLRRGERGGAAVPARGRAGEEALPMAAHLRGGTPRKSNRRGCDAAAGRDPALRRRSRGRQRARLGARRRLKPRFQARIARIISLIAHRTYAHTASFRRVRGTSAPASMLPLIDICNHSFEPNVEVRPGVGGAMELRALVPLPPGEPLLLSYGPLSNDFLLMDYGFIVPGNPHDRAALRFSAGLIDFAREVAGLGALPFGAPPSKAGAGGRGASDADELSAAPWQRAVLSELKLIGTGANLELNVGGPSHVDPRLLAALRLLYCTDAGALRGMPRDGQGAATQRVGLFVPIICCARRANTHSSLSLSLSVSLCFSFAQRRICRRRRARCRPPTSAPRWPRLPRCAPWRCRNGRGHSQTMKRCSPPHHRPTRPCRTTRAWRWRSARERSACWRMLSRG